MTIVWCANCGGTGHQPKGAAAMRSGAPPQTDSVEALAEARGFAPGELIGSGDGSSEGPLAFGDVHLKVNGCEIKARSTVVRSLGGNVFMVGSDDVVHGTPGQQTGEPLASQSTEGQEQVGAPPTDDGEAIQAKIDAEAERWAGGWRMDSTGKAVPAGAPLDLTREEAKALYVASRQSPLKDHSVGVGRDARLKLEAFLAGAPPEDDGKDSLRAEVEFLREQQLGTEDDG